jgi:hypothetical protein
MDPHRSGNGQIWALTLSVFIDLEYLGGKESIDFEVFRTTHGMQKYTFLILGRK